MASMADNMAIAHRDYLLATLDACLCVLTLLLCVLAELSIFAFRLHSALYLLPMGAPLLLLHRFRRRRRASDIGLVDFACLKPPRRLRVPLAGLMAEHLHLIGCFDAGSVEFMRKVMSSSGMGDETYFPATLHQIPPLTTHAAAIAEAHALFFPTLDALFAKTTTVNPASESDVGVLVVSCSGFCPAPSLSSIIAARYAMRDDVRTFNLSGMGCGGGAVAVDVARGVLLEHAVDSTSYAVVVSAEIVTVGWYDGKEQSKLLLNCFFRTGCSAALLTTTTRNSKRKSNIKYRLKSVTRTNQIADDLSYGSGYREEDDEGITGFNVGAQFGRMASEVLRAHLVTLGPSILPWREKLRYVLALFLSSSSASEGPDFRQAADHFCLPASGRPVILRLGKGLGLGEREMEAALMTFHRFGNQSAASMWYQLAYMEAKGRVREGDTVWMLGIGTGLKANSLVWERVAGHGHGGGGKQDEMLGPWKDCIHRYPVVSSPQKPKCKCNACH